MLVLLLVGAIAYACVLTLFGSCRSSRPPDTFARQVASARAAERAHLLSAIVARPGWQAGAALPAEALVAGQTIECDFGPRAFVAGCEWHSTALLLQVEAARSIAWNGSRHVVLVGLKVQQIPVPEDTSDMWFTLDAGTTQALRIFWPSFPGAMSALKLDVQSLSWLTQEPFFNAPHRHNETLLSTTGRSGNSSTM